MTRLTDRLLLLVSALALGALLLSGSELLRSRWHDELWAEFWIVSVMFILVGFWIWLLAIRGRHQRVRRWYPIALAWAAVITMHVLLIGAVIYTYRPHWRMADWMVVGSVEWIAFGVLLEFGYRRSTAAGSR